MSELSAENFRSLARFYYDVTERLTELAIEGVPAKEVVTHLFKIAWISGITACESGNVTHQEIMEIERDAYAYASRSAEEESDQ